MNCPECKAKAKCIATRENRVGVARRFACACGVRFSTLEAIVPNAKQGKELKVSSAVVDRPEIARIVKLLREAEEIAQGVLET